MSQEIIRQLQIKGNLRTFAFHIEMLGWIILCSQGVPGLYTLDSSSASHFVTAKNVYRHYQVTSRGGGGGGKNLPQLRTTSKQKKRVVSSTR